MSKAVGKQEELTAANSLLDKNNTDLLWSEEPSRMLPKDIDNLLIYCVECDASDITLQTDRTVMAEVFGRLSSVTKRSLSNAEASEILNHIYGDNGVAQLMSGQDVDTHYEVRLNRSQRYRFRVNGTALYSEGHEGLQITFRTIPSTPPTIESMDLSNELVESMMPYQGIVVVSGATGSGKSTLLSAVMRKLLETRNGKILTYEAPIEFVYDDVVAPNALISQHEIPRHLPSFPLAVRNALRRKPAYILVGEARDKETISAVIDAALTGHTVYTTVHANGVADTIRRMISVFPVEERAGRVMDLIYLMRVILWQTLLPTRDGKRVAVREWLDFSEDVRHRLLATI